MGTMEQDQLILECLAGIVWLIVFTMFMRDVYLARPQSNKEGVSDTNSNRYSSLIRRIF